MKFEEPQSGLYFPYKLIILIVWIILLFGIFIILNKTYWTDDGIGTRQHIFLQECGKKCNEITNNSNSCFSMCSQLYEEQIVTMWGR